ncbi:MULTISPECIES: response regulator transcription factor [unclassified Coleofasciculus]|uniref:response regulator transcription factor n=1 Tax=unclassified Coleofasciculus TaxID=2692782 RepID=UPI00187E8EC6|nr:MULTISPECIES: response regulator transcription factor [unclassified Coleofasciculus]MBE9129537.1 response regulator transcription factor [Coleofasciculus sp. LEGE 07081]MBE9150056.1 response regulator transcription factor [Coleofasciculus sp. LEGE 07092]
MSAQLLLVDDEPGIRESVPLYLEEVGGFSVKVASNANDAWQILQQHTPDLVITDVMMPQVDGYQFLKKLRDDPRFRTLPVIFLTARGMTSDRIQGYQAGCDMYIPKPFDTDELIAVVENLLERRSATTPENSSNTELLNIEKELTAIREMLAQRGNITQTPPPIRIDFTPREQSVLDLVAQGLMNKEIARRLDTSVRNVEKYVSRLFSKTGTNSRTELVRYALEHGLTH